MIGEERKPVLPNDRQAEICRFVLVFAVTWLPVGCWTT